MVRFATHQQDVISSYWPQPQITVYTAIRPAHLLGAANPFLPHPITSGGRKRSALVLLFDPETNCFNDALKLTGFIRNDDSAGIQYLTDTSLICLRTAIDRIRTRPNANDLPETGWAEYPEYHSIRSAAGKKSIRSRWPCTCAPTPEPRNAQRPKSFATLCAVHSAALQSFG